MYVCIMHGLLLPFLQLRLFNLFCINFFKCIEVYQFRKNICQYSFSLFLFFVFFFVVVFFIGFLFGFPERFQMTNCFHANRINKKTTLETITITQLHINLDKIHLKSLKICFIFKFQIKITKQQQQQQQKPSNIATAMQSI